MAWSDHRLTWPQKNISSTRPPCPRTPVHHVPAQHNKLTTGVGETVAAPPPPLVLSPSMDGRNPVSTPHHGTSISLTSRCFCFSTRRECLTFPQTSGLASGRERSCAPRRELGLSWPSCSVRRLGACLPPRAMRADGPNFRARP